MRVFLGTTEIANVIHNYAKGFRAHGVKTLSLVEEKSWAYPDSSYDIVLCERLGVPTSGRRLGARVRMLWWRLRYWVLALRLILQCDVFVFVFGSSFSVRRLDYRLLKLLGKRIVSVFLGDDIRYWYAYTQEAEASPWTAEVRPYLDRVLRNRPHDYLAVKLATVQDAERHADLILSEPGSAQLLSKPYARVKIPIDLAALRFHVSDREVPVVVHAPSDRGIKGTEYVLKAVEQLYAEGLQFEFRLLDRMPNALVREQLSEADIVVDQVYSGNVATLALESMAAGNAVLARHLHERSRLAPDCPVVHATIETLADRLREVILNRELRMRLAYAGREWVAEHHDLDRVAGEILQWLQEGGARAQEITPTFFQQQFVMSRALAQQEAEQLRTEAGYMKATSLDGVRFLP